MNKSADILYNFRRFLTVSERRFLASVSPYRTLTWAQADVVRTIHRRARRRMVAGY